MPSILILKILHGTVELNGAKISMEKTPHLTFNSENASLTGNDGCNAFNAAYTLNQTSVLILMIRQ